MTSILFIGNFGTGCEGQKKVALLMKEIINKYKCRFILGLGNNFYPHGIKSLKDKQFETNFEEPYYNISKNIKFFNVLGEYDYYPKSSPLNQIKYTCRSDKWIMPHNFYCFRKRFNNIPVEFIGIDTNLSKMKNRKLQEQWILNTIYESKCRWIIVFGYHPWKYFGLESCDAELDELYTKINSIGKVDLILSGNEFNKQHIYVPGKPDMVVCGVGAIEGEPIKFYNNEEIKFFSGSRGCGMIEFSRNVLKICFFDTDMVKEYSFIINKI